MPFVERTHHHEGEATFGKVPVKSRIYVPRNRLLPTDRIVPVGEIPDGTLRDLCIAHPEEYAQAAELRGFPLAAAAPVDEDEDAGEGEPPDEIDLSDLEEEEEEDGRAGDGHDE